MKLTGLIKFSARVMLIVSMPIVIVQAMDWVNHGEKNPWAVVFSLIAAVVALGAMRLKKSFVAASIIVWIYYLIWFLKQLTSNFFIDTAVVLCCSMFILTSMKYLISKAKE